MLIMVSIVKIIFQSRYAVKIICDDWEKPKKYPSERPEQLNSLTCDFLIAYLDVLPQSLLRGLV